ncbi:hypothetical protein BFS06_12125 [Clostridium perfringens]|nr:hypothetical protein BFS06_12125 [Clostridium perfringens]
MEDSSFFFILKRGVYLKYMSKIKKFIKNNKGIATLELAIGMIILIIILIFSIDLLKIAHTYYVSGQQLNYVARTIGIEGGVHAQEPKGFPEKYYTSADIIRSMKQGFASTGIKEKDFYVVIKNLDNNKSVTLKPTSNITVDYAQGVDVELHVKYKWSLLSQIIPMMNQGNREFTLKRFVVSEFKYNYNDWD